MKNSQDWQTAFDAMDMRSASAGELRDWIKAVQDDARAELLEECDQPREDVYCPLCEYNVGEHYALYRRTNETNLATSRSASQANADSR